MSDVIQPQPKAATGTTHKHPFKVAAAAGFGPLSAKSKEIWHGHSTPCVSCGMLNIRSAGACAHCGQDFNQNMLERMAKHSGPWFVFDSVRPFPGVSLDRVLLQINRGVLTQTSIVRGPTTFYQWRFAGETPILSKFLGMCWSCQTDVGKDERFCPQCKVVLDGFHRPGQLTVPESPEAAAELERLGKMVDEVQAPGRTAHRLGRIDRPLGKPLFIFFIIAAVVVLSLVTLVSLYGSGDKKLPANTSQHFVDPAISAIILA